MHMSYLGVVITMSKLYLANTDSFTRVQAVILQAADLLLLVLISAGVVLSSLQYGPYSTQI